MVLRINPVCSAAKQRQLKEIGEWLGVSLPSCADVFLTDKGFWVTGSNLEFELNESGQVDQYLKTGPDTKTRLSGRPLIKPEGFRKVRGLLLFTEELLDHPKFSSLNQSAVEGEKPLRVAWVLNKQDGDNRTEGRRFKRLSVRLKESGTCESSEDAGKQIIQSLIDLCNARESKRVLINSGWNKAVCRNGGYNVDIEGACLDYTTTYSGGCATTTITSSTSCPTTGK